MKKFLSSVMVLTLATLPMAQTPDDVKREPLPGGYVRVTTPAYTIEVPKGWEVGAQTSFGQRELKKGSESMSAMTGPGAGAMGWDRLYKTSLFYIQRGKTAKATPYKIGKTAQGYEACSFSILEADGFASSRYVIIKAESNNILALSVKISEKKKEKDLAAAFDRMVQTAKLK